MKPSTKKFSKDYLSRGFSLLPLHTAVERNGVLTCSCGKEDCAAPAKHPLGNLVPKGLKDASSSPDKIKGWFSSLAARNIGIATGNVSAIIVLDIDVRHNGDKSLAVLEKKYEPLPKTLRWKTGGGGEHILFKYPGETIKNSAGMLGEGIDVRGDNGYIVAPPSRHITGNYYQLYDGVTLDTELAEIPAWLLDLLRQGKGSNSTSAKGPAIRDVVRAQVPEGQRNTTIARISGHLLAKRVDTRICLDLVLAFNEKYCSPPLDEKEVAKVVASIEHLAFTKLINR